MSEFFRGPQWPSQNERSKWEPQIQAANAAWNEMEVMSISTGIRKSALLLLSPEELVNATTATRAQGLELTVLASQQRGDGYSAGAATHGPPGFRVAVHLPELGAPWVSAWQSNDNKLIGKLLGFPPCCIDFFEDTWVKERRVDPTPAMKGADGPYQANILLRWLGVRLVPHLPCSFNCKLTVSMGVAFEQMAIKAGMVEEMKAMQALLSLPMYYSALNGIGAVIAPDFRFYFATDQRAEEHRVDRSGEDAPEIEMPEESRSITIWGDNGFGTKKAMQDAHGEILKAVEGKPTIVDLGCGDGTLLSQFQMRGSKFCWGCDYNVTRLERGRRRYPDLKLEFGRLEELDWPEADITLFMPARLLEMDEETRKKVHQKLAKRKIVVYAYGDHLERWHGLINLCQEVGIHVDGEAMVHKGNGVEVIV